MGYDLQAIISTHAALEAAAASFAAAAVCPLAGGFALVPITDELLDEVGAAGDSGRFYKFTPAISEWLRLISLSAPAAYVEAEYFGGSGGQSAVVWSLGAESLPPTHSSDAINRALRLLGVSHGSWHDEFEAVGLPRHRHTDDWLGDTRPETRTA